MNLQDCDIIYEGTVIDSQKQEYQYQFIHNKSKNAWPNYECEVSWRNFKLFYMNRFVDIKGNVPIDAVEELCFHDYHWSWTKKYYYSSSNYKYDWFYILIDGKIQAISLTSHPFESQFDKKEVFYIEYLAVAPWNRCSKYYERKFTGIGSLFVQSIAKYYVSVYHYRLGFALSAVPQAIGFYKKIGMTAIPQMDHDGLSFYEMEEVRAEEFVRGDGNE